MKTTSIKYNPSKLYVMYSLLLIGASILLSSCKKELKASDPLPLIYSNVYIIGDASPALWNIDAAIKMTVNPANKTQFTWTGPLTAGEIKFATQKSFSSDFFVAATASQSVSNNKAQIALSGNPDIKWKLSAAEAGTYQITVDMNAVTVTFKKQ
ncbi:SusF/SusE family outer membrane protein [Pedobacter jejuensis]|uniref:SusF/SusE family outer membrane protein n=1 Tax=Pedobacter jejuensis TaxID=1268550 RepID=A0A3N0C2C8_9SPHI|nr:SusF/SusE family outer membrane protein [Pedobacter jejuensis]RNL56551.1 SusF/SusE family outer membrane protein [Pedobacter jejuensis]